MFRRLIACLLVFFLFCSPVYASTSSSALDYHAMPMSLDDTLVTSAESAGVEVSVVAGLYDLSSDSIFVETPSVSSIVGSDGSLSFYGGYLDISGYDYSSSNIKVSSRFKLSNLDWVSGRSYRVIANNYYLQFISFGSHPGSFEAFFTDSAYPFLAYVDCYWSGTMKRGNSFVPFSNKRVRVPLSSIITKYVQRSDGFVGDIDFTINADAPFSTIVEDGYEYEFVSGKITEIDLCQIYDIDSSNFYDLTNEKLSSVPLDISTGFSAYVSPVYLNIIYSSSGFGSSTDSLISSGIKSVNSSISSLSNNMNVKFNEVKQTIQQGASDVKNEILNQTQTLTDKLTDVKETTKQGFEDVVQGITDLPGKIQEMLTDFIVPDEDSVADKMTDFQSLAEEKLGIIYQVPEMMFDSVNALVDGATNPQSTMTFPAFSLPWIDGSQLKVWDSQEFEIIPSGLENLRDLIQTVTSMVFVIMTFNSLKRAYERFFLGGGS